MKCTYSKGDRVETPLGVGAIITEIEITGACKVRLDKPLASDNRDGDKAGDQEITANTFQMRHERPVHERIQALLTQAEALKVGNSDSRKADQAAFEAEVTAAWKRKFPRRKFSLKTSADKVKGNQPEHGAIYDKWMQKVDADYKAFKAKLDAIEEQIKGLAQDAVIPVSAKMVLFHTVNSSSYQSQGFGMNKYAEADAQDYVDKAVAYGLQAELRKVKVHEGRDQFGHSWTYYEFQVWVGTTPLGVEILSRKSGRETMAEWIAKCDRKGVCARVFAPFMSYEQEEALRDEARKAKAG